MEINKYELNGIFSEMLRISAPIPKDPKFKNDEYFLQYVKRAIIVKSPVRRNYILNLLWNYKKRKEDLESIEPLFLNTEISDIIKGEKVVGIITKSGDGIRGMLGSGPVMYTFSRILKIKEIKNA